MRLCSAVLKTRAEHKADWVMKSMCEYWKSTSYCGSPDEMMVVWTKVVASAIDIHGFKGYLRCRINTIRRLTDVKCV